MIIAGIILVIVSIVVLIIIGIYDDEPGNVIFSWLLGITFFAGVMLFITELTENNPAKKSLKDNTLEIEIKQEVVNGEEISRDTVYIFTPKKK